MPIDRFNSEKIYKYETFFYENGANNVWTTVTGAADVGKSSTSGYLSTHWS